MLMLKTLLSPVDATFHTIQVLCRSLAVPIWDATVRTVRLMDSLTDLLLVKLVLELLRLHRPCPSMAARIISDVYLATAYHSVAPDPLATCGIDAWTSSPCVNAW